MLSQLIVELLTCNFSKISLWNCWFNVSHQYSNIFMSSQLQVLKAWDVKEQVCLQTIAIRFPFGHRIPEHGPFPFFLITSPINSLFIGSNDCLAEIKIVGMSANKSTKTTHWKPLCAALYNPSMGQVSVGAVAGC